VEIRAEHRGCGRGELPQKGFASGESRGSCGQLSLSDGSQSSLGTAARLLGSSGTESRTTGWGRSQDTCRVARNGPHSPAVRLHPSLQLPVSRAPATPTYSRSSPRPDGPLQPQTSAQCAGLGGAVSQGKSVWEGDPIGGRAGVPQLPLPLSHPRLQPGNFLAANHSQCKKLLRCGRPSPLPGGNPGPLSAPGTCTSPPQTRLQRQHVKPTHAHCSRGPRPRKALRKTGCPAEMPHPAVLLPQTLGQWSSSAPAPQRWGEAIPSLRASDFAVQGWP